MQSKDERRKLVQDSLPPSPMGGTAGKVAEQVRRLAPYRSARQIFVSPSPMLSQIRINALVDGKELFLPGPGLKDGFYRLLPYVVPFRELAYAVSFKGLDRYGKIVPVEEIGQLSLDLMFTEVVAVDSCGGFLGDGQGFFDLSVALLAELNGLTGATELYGLGADAQLLQDDLPLDIWDVRLNGFVTASGLRPFHNESVSARVCWEILSQKRIKKITPLWKLSHRA